MSMKANELATAELVDQGLAALKSRSYRRALELWEEVYRRHPDHPRAERLVHELRTWIQRRDEVQPRTALDETSDTTQTQAPAADFQRVEKRIRDLEQRLDSAIGRKNELLDEINELHDHYRGREEELRKAHDQRVERLNEELQELRKSNDGLRQADAESTHEVARLERERDEAQTRANKQLAEAERLSQKLAETESVLQSTREERENLRKELAAYDADEIEQLRKVAEKLEPLEAQLVESRGNAEKLEEQRDVLQATIDDLKTELAERETQAHEQLETLNSLVEQYSRESESLESKLAEAVDHVAEIQRSHQDEVEAYQQEINQLRNALEEAPSASVVEELEQQRELNAKLAGQLRAVEVQLNAIGALGDDENSDVFDLSGIVGSADELRAEFVDGPSNDAPTEAPDDASPTIEPEEDAAFDLTFRDDGSDASGDGDTAASPFDVAVFADESDDVFDEDSRDPEHESDDVDNKDAQKKVGVRSTSSPPPPPRELQASDEPDGASGEFEALLLETPEPALDERSPVVQKQPSPPRESISISMIDDVDTRVALTKSGDVDDDDLSPMSTFVLSRIDDDATVGELIDTVGLPASRTVSCLEELYDRGLISFDR